jgi:hypothetical protein
MIVRDASKWLDECFPRWRSVMQAHDNLLLDSQAGRPTTHNARCVSRNEGTVANCNSVNSVNSVNFVASVAPIFFSRPGDYQLR